MTPPSRQLPIEKITKANTALLIIDLQHDFIDEDAPCTTEGGRQIVPVICSLAEWAREHTLPIIFTQEAHRPDRSDFGIELEFEAVHCLEGTRGFDLVEGAPIAAGDYRIISKRRYDCFMGTDLDLLLRCKRIENLVCVGVCTNICVLNTVLTARNLDYRVLLPADAVAGTTVEHHNAALLCMSAAYAYLTDSSDVIKLWR